jgi:hypothetical protein
MYAGLHIIIIYLSKMVVARRLFLSSRRFVKILIINLIFRLSNGCKKLAAMDAKFAR